MTKAFSRRARAAVFVLVVGGAPMLAAGGAGADTPDPIGAPGCKGNIVATFNHGSGPDQQSRGPGFFFRSGFTAEAVQGVQDFFCP